ncbi:related to citrate lyase beta subunit [Ceraceosorus bombacis]|uniref:Related to citrate lyase beta subunit n=1 Tax=Ceraceosorus bombacis TaxID=401625 RepID=A0A0P1BHQ2_9BASI|nr:related to citrate lyase beta subunit [Ceraceosorus bombacis]
MEKLLSHFYDDDGHEPFLGKVWPIFHEHGIAALLFASEDYCAASGIQRSRSRKELLFPRAHMATIAKAHGLSAIDMVCIDYKDDEYLREESLEGRSIGMDGKQAIHPSQVKAIQKAYLPSEEDIERATRIQEAYESSIAAGAGAVGLKEKDGSTIMIDTPMLLQARTTLRKARAAGLNVPDPDA